MMRNAPGSNASIRSVAMLNVLLALALGCRAPEAVDFDALAKARNADGLMAAASEMVKKDPRVFDFIRRNGPYGAGRFGWTAIPLTTPTGARYVVFSTKITSEDYGEVLFETDGEKLLRYIPESETMGIRIEHQKMDIRFNTAEKSATLLSEVTFRKTKSDANGFVIRMSPQYRISAVTEAGKPVKYVQSGGVAWLPAPSSERFHYRLQYKGVVDLPQYAGSITAREALLTNDYWYPMIARMPATYEATVHVPGNWTAVAQGELVKDITQGGERQMTWKMDLPVTYWSLSAAAYKTFTATIKGRKYTVWSLSMSPEQMRLQTELSAPVIEFYETFAPYPFSTWGAVDSPQYGGGALEAYSFATYGTGWLPDEDTHEPAHTWWGGMINNTYLNSLWNESFANYSGGLYNREGPLGNRDEKRLAFVDDASPSSGYDRVPLSDSGVFTGPASSNLGYGKGAKVLQTLEVELGPEAMTAAMRHWLRSHPKGEPGEWHHFEQAVKESSGRDMKTFFDEWVRRPGWANFTVENVTWSDGAVTGETVFRDAPYALLTEVLLQYEDGKRVFTRVRLEPKKRGAFRIESNAKPVLVSFDPWRKLLREYEANEAPTMISTALQRAKKYVDPAHSGWMDRVRGNTTLSELPANLDGVFIVGSPETTPAMKPLCEKAGFQVAGNKLTYDGTTIDLDTQGAIAVVDLASGGKCVIGLGKTRRAPSTGRARTALVDNLGRFLRGRTDPKTSGFLTVKL